MDLVLFQNAENQSLDVEKEENELTSQIQQAHEECQKYQLQLNLANNSIKRYDSALLLESPHLSEIRQLLYHMSRCDLR